MSLRFRSRVLFTGYVSCKSGAKVNAKGDSRLNPPDLYVLKDLSGTQYISGSNLKSLLRKQVEFMVRENLGAQYACESFNKENACIRLGSPLNRTANVISGNSNMHVSKKEAVYLQDIIEYCGENDELLIEEIEKNTCFVCSLFGSPLVDSLVQIEDLKPMSWIGQFKSKQEIFESTCDRFMFRIVLENCPTWKRGLFIIGLSRLQNKLLTLSLGKQTEQSIATIEGLTVKSLETTSEFLSCLSQFKPTEGKDVDTQVLQSWIDSLRNHVKSVSNLAAAC